jgi:hypothetical protein
MLKSKSFFDTRHKGGHLAMNVYVSFRHMVINTCIGTRGLYMEFIYAIEKY